ncbi:molybdenum cofactor guanylyltransferase [Cytophagaceae bacterium ABcell3]|nr:molybdenum cofactor guanylyltransferase [Cytophagaceae bacterium ABcell3]
MISKTKDRQTEADNITAFILAGYDTLSPGAFPKGLLRSQGRSYIENISDKLKTITSEIKISANTNDYNHLALPVYTDLVSGLGPLGGIYTALTVSSTSRNLLVACDIPMVSSEFLKQLTMYNEYDLVLPQVNDKLYPLCACYNISSLNKINHLIKRGESRLNSLVNILNCKVVKADSLNLFGGGDYLISA